MDGKTTKIIALRQPLIATTEEQIFYALRVDTAAFDNGIGDMTRHGWSLGHIERPAVGLAYRCSGRCDDCCFFHFLLLEYSWSLAASLSG